MAEQLNGHASAPSPAPATSGAVNNPPVNGHSAQQDIEMADGALHTAEVKVEGNIDPSAPQPAPASLAQPQPSASLAAQTEAQMAPRTGTPVGSTRGSTPAIPGALPPSAIIPDAHPNGSPARVFMNLKVTPSLLEGMKQVTAQQPEKPLQWLGEFLLKKSQELEGS